jgi:hypothetical protein
MTNEDRVAEELRTWPTDYLRAIGSQMVPGRGGVMHSYRPYEQGLSWRLFKLTVTMDRKVVRSLFDAELGRREAATPPTP